MLVMVVLRSFEMVRVVVILLVVMQGRKVLGMATADRSDGLDERLAAGLAPFLQDRLG